MAENSDRDAPAPPTWMWLGRAANAAPCRSLSSVATVPIERVSPFLLLAEDDADLVLVAPFPKRRGGSSPDETALVRAVARLLMRDPPAARPCWIDPQTGTATPVAISEAHLRRRMVDNASFNVRPK